MIRIEIDDEQLRADISEVSPTWLSRAEVTMASNTPDELGESPAWGDIKRAYIAVQNGKCGYCERKITQDVSYRPMWRSQDVEHYRPKGAAKAWPPPTLTQERQLEYPAWLVLGEAGASGYYRLTHHCWNYLASCAACNQAHKRDYFPIANVRALDGDDPATMNEQEWPYLLYPLGEFDDDPCDLIRFEGLLPLPVEMDPELHDHWRARITIDFFDLTSEEIIIDRADSIVMLAVALSHPDTGDGLAAQLVVELTSVRAKHSACAMAFHDLWRRDRAAAEVVADRAAAILAQRR